LSKRRVIATIVLIAFLIILAKDIFINELQYINPYTPTNRIISWFIILPLIVIGTLLSIWVLTLLPASMKSKIKSLDLYLILPFFLYIGYFVLQIVFVLVAT
jgi:hypothetical protein